MGTVIHGRALVAGEAYGELLVSREPLSFWGGYDQHTGEIIDRRHPLSGERASNRILALPSTRGSSTTTAVLLEAIRAGTAPAALITAGVDHFLALASIVADEMYAAPIPVVALEPDDFDTLKRGQRVRVFADGMIEVWASESASS
ncbi:MAG: aconitase X swivel domain-containing protein [Rhodothermales bacterium]